VKSLSKNQNEKCKDCVTGRKALELDRKSKAKEITRRQFTVEAHAIGSICIPCIFNGTGGRKAKFYKKVYPPFQTMDMFEQYTEVKK
jgi:hypothetical protein